MYTASLMYFYFKLVNRNCMYVCIGYSVIFQYMFIICNDKVMVIDTYPLRYIRMNCLCWEYSNSFLATFWK